MMFPDSAFGWWNALIAAVSLFNTAQAYTGNLALSRKVYSEAPNEVTQLSNRTFGTWTGLVSVIRLVAAYNLHDRTVRLILFSTYAAAFLHFMSEWLVFKTTKMGSGLAGPFVAATGSMVWMWMSYT